MLADLLGSLAGRVLGGVSLVALVALAALGLRLHHVTGQRDALQAWQDDVVTATRDAAHRPKLAPAAVARQVRFLGAGLDQVREAMATATAKALAAKLAREGTDETNRKVADDAVHSNLGAALRDTDAYARDHGVCGGPERPAAADHGGAGGPDLSSAADAPRGADRSGAGPALVSVPRSALDACTTLKVRLDAGRAWALKLSSGAGR